MGALLKRSGAALLAFALPPHCLICQQPVPVAALLCRGCRQEVGPGAGPRCQRCSQSVDEAAQGCRHCQPWSLSCQRLLVMNDFSPAMQRAVHLLKFGRQRRLGRYLGRMMGRTAPVRTALRQVQALVPVPLHAARQRQRGYNQSLEVALGLAEVSGVPVAAGLLRRRRATQAQAQLAAGGRRDNLAGAFAVGGGAVPTGWIGLVDDVVTTGATLEEAARTLLAAGAQSVWGMALARPPEGRVTDA